MQATHCAPTRTVADNRGAKLALLAETPDVAVPRVPSVLVRTPAPHTAAQAAAIEGAFVCAQHVRGAGALPNGAENGAVQSDEHNESAVCDLSPHGAEAPGMTPGEARLVFSAWAGYAEDAPGLRALRGLPARLLCTAPESAGLRDTLSANVVLRISHDLMTVIETGSAQIKTLRRAARVLRRVPDESGGALERLVLLIDALEERQIALHDALAAVRSDLEGAARYGRVVGRFLLKRRRRILASLDV